MLQQTQVPRVVGKYESFLKKFPTARSLAEAPLSQVLEEWSGLGYNRRAKYLHDCVRHAIHNNGPVGLLCKGIGPYTRAAVRAFAYNEAVAMIETNIRTALIHHFCGLTKGEYQGLPLISDKELLGLMEQIIQGEKRPRDFYWALMDYGAHLKASGVRNNHRSAHYTKQSKFDGSLRQTRGIILRRLHAGPSLMDADEKTQRALASLARDGLVRKTGARWRIA